MAVTKIHRTSRLTLIVSMVISIVVLGLFFFGGQVAEHQKIAPDMAQPAFTDILLYWMYALLVVTIIVLIGFAIADLARGLKENPKKALSGLSAILALAALLVVTYVIGDGTLLSIPGYEGTDNVPSILKMTDMWLYSMYFMLVVTIASIILLPLVIRKK
jgi:amino acid transporter